jgi:ribosome-associated protein
MNKEDALSRLKSFIQSVMVMKKNRKPTKPTKGSVQRRLAGKANRKVIKETRKKVQF